MLVKSGFCVVADDWVVLVEGVVLVVVVLVVDVVDVVVVMTDTVWMVPSVTELIQLM